MPRLIAFAALLSFAPTAFPDDGPAAALYVPRDAAALVSVRLGQLAAAGHLKALSTVLPGINPDKARILNDFEKLFGVAPADVDWITSVLRRPSTPPVIIIRTTKALDADAYAKKLGRTKELKIDGKAVLLAERPFDLFGVPNAFWLAEDKMIVAGTPGALKGHLAALKAGWKDHPLAAGLKAVAAKHTLVVAARPEFMFRVAAAEGGSFFDRGQGEKATKVEPPPLPPEKDRPKDTDKGKGRRRAPAVEKDEKEGKETHEEDEERPLKLRTLDEILEGERGFGRVMLVPVLPLIKPRIALLTADLVPRGVSISARVEFASADDAKDGETVLAMARLIARESFAGFLGNVTGADPKEKSLTALVKKVKDAVRGVELKREGKEVTASAELSLDLAPLVKFIAEQAPVRQEENHLKNIVLAFHNFESSYGNLPTQAICDKGGKPLLSWRVAILPYIEQGALYKKFKLDEAWDSEHNKKLLPLMPSIYLAPARKAARPGETFYQVFTGPDGLYPKPDSKVGLVRITDGLSNTILVAEAAKSVPWTKPEDIVVPAMGVPKLGGQFKGFFHVAMFDGSVRKVKNTVSEKTLRAAITPNAGDVLGDDW
jgi:hypothetical protein